MFAGLGAMHFSGVELAVPSDDGGLLAGCDVSSSLRNRCFDPASRRSTILSEIQSVRLGYTIARSGHRHFPTDTWGDCHLEHSGSYTIQLLVYFLLPILLFFSFSFSYLLSCFRLKQKPRTFIGSYLHVIPKSCVTGFQIWRVGATWPDDCWYL